MDKFSFFASLVHLEKQAHTNQPKPEKAARMAGRGWQEKKKVHKLCKINKTLALTVTLLFQQFKPNKIIFNHRSRDFRTEEEFLQ